MDKNQHIHYWVLTAQDDWDTVEYLYEGKRYVQALFFTHLAIEKLLKAFWVKNNVGNTPPKTHNLGYLVEQSKLELPEDDVDFLLILSDYQIEGRYPDYLTLLHKNTQQARAAQVITTAKNLISMVERAFAIEIVRDFIKKCEEQQVTLSNVILFGSTATGSAQEFSDIDVLLASEQFGFDRWENLYLIVKAKRAYNRIEAHTYPTDYFLKGDPFIDEVKRTGILIK